MPMRGNAEWISTTPFCNSRQGTLQPLESDWMVSTIRRVPTWYSCPKVLPVGAGHIR